MVIFMRPFLFQVCDYPIIYHNYAILVENLQSSAAIFETCPNSPIFKQLPALANPDVQNWMSTTYRSELSALRAREGSPIDIQRMQDRLLRTALEEVRALQAKHTNEIGSLLQLVNRRTSALSPTKGFAMESYQRSACVFSLAF